MGGYKHRTFGETYPEAFNAAETSEVGQVGDARSGEGAEKKGKNRQLSSPSTAIYDQYLVNGGEIGVPPG